jgi:hypothetical protein
LIFPPPPYQLVSRLGPSFLVSAEVSAIHTVLRIGAWMQRRYAHPFCGLLSSNALKRQWRWFAITLATSVAWFAAVIYFIQPILFHHPNEYVGHGNLTAGWLIKE